jgi:hypothetical protein
VKEHEMGGTCRTHGEIGNAYKVLFVELEGKRPLWEPWRRLEDGIKFDFKRTGCEQVNWNQM